MISSTKCFQVLKKTPVDSIGYMCFPYIKLPEFLKYILKGACAIRSFSMLVLGNTQEYNHSSKSILMRVLRIHRLILSLLRILERHIHWINSESANTSLSILAP